MNRSPRDPQAHGPQAPSRVTGRTDCSVDNLASFQPRNVVGVHGTRNAPAPATLDAGLCSRRFAIENAATSCNAKRDPLAGNSAVPIVADSHMQSNCKNSFFGKNHTGGHDKSWSQKPLVSDHPRQPQTFNFAELCVCGFSLSRIQTAADSPHPGASIQIR